MSGKFGNFVCKCQVGRPGNEARASSVDPATQQIRFTNWYIHTYIHTYIHRYIHTYIHTYMNQRVVAAKQVHINDTQNNTLFELPWVGLKRTTLCYYLNVFLLLHCTRLQRYRLFHFAVCHTVYNCGCLLNIVGLCLKISSAVSSTITAILTLLRWGMQV